MTPKDKKKKRGVPGKNGSTPPRKGPRARRRLVVTVVCEGMTERDYLEGIDAQESQTSSFVINLAPRSQPGGGFKPTPAVERAIEAKKSLAAGDRGRVWVVFDRDQNKDVHQAMRLAKDNKINVAFSTPSFDLWLWLHFAPGLPSEVSADNERVVRKLNSVPPFEHYGKASGGKNSDSKPKTLNKKQFAELWDQRESAVTLARRLVDRCWDGTCRAKEKPAEPGHAHNCDPMKRDTQTDFYRLMELLGVDGRPAGRPRKNG